MLCVTGKEYAHIKLVQLCHHTAMLLSSLHEVHIYLREQDLADSIDDTVVMGVEVNRELRTIQLASLS